MVEKNRPKEHDCVLVTLAHIELEKDPHQIFNFVPMQAVKIVYILDVS